MLAGGAFSAETASGQWDAIGSREEPLRVGLIGCGSQGTSHAVEMLNLHRDSHRPECEVRLVGMADLREHKLQASYRTIRGRCRHGVEVEQCRFTGPDAFRRLLDEEMDLIILAGPTSFRQSHFHEAVQSGKHCLVESPFATTIDGIDCVMQSNQSALEKELSIVSGLHRSFGDRFRQTVEQIRQGAMGDLLYGRLSTGYRVRRLPVKPAKQEEHTYRLAHWQHFQEFIGDPSDEAMAESIAMLQILLGQVPTQAHGHAGFIGHAGFPGQTKSMDAPSFRSMEYVYENGFRLFARSASGDSKGLHRGFFLHGTGGSCDLTTGEIRDVTGKVIWQPERGEDDLISSPWQTPAGRLVRSIRSRSPFNELSAAAIANRSVIQCRNSTDLCSENPLQTETQT